MEDGVEESSKKLAELAPVVGASQGDSIVDLIEGYEALAASLGADVRPAPVAEAKDRLRGRPRRVQGGGRGQARPDRAGRQPVRRHATRSPCRSTPPSSSTSRRWGLDVIVPDDARTPSSRTGRSLSFEQADTYQPDLLLFDDRNYPGNLEMLEEQPIADSIKAFAAGAYTTWPAYWLHTYGTTPSSSSG